MGPIRLSIEDLASASAMQPAEEALRMVPGVISVRREASGNIVLVEAAESVRTDDLIAALLKVGVVATLAG